MSKANPQTIITDRLLQMEQTTPGLRRQKNNLYSHLCQLLSQLPLSSDSQNRKIDSVKELASISQYIKNCTNRQNKAEPLPEDKLNQLITRRTQYPEWLLKKRQLLVFWEKTKQQAKTSSIHVQNFEKVHKSLFLGAGLSFGDEQALRINVAIQKLRQKVNAHKIRFWGKILTRKSDYYVIQGVVDKKFPEKTEQGMERYKEGVNYYSYWVNNLSMQNQWRQLPLITPAQMRASRFLKYAFTGDLNAQIKSYPVFPGKEEHLLKAQLVRITHNCEVAPKGLYGPTEQNPDEIEFTQEFKMPEFADISNLQNWVHLNSHILDLGRASYWVDPKLSQEQKEESMSKLTESDPKMDRLKGINEDKPVEGKGVETSWFLKTLGSTQLYNNVGKDEGSTSCYGLVLIKNINWPGWITVSSSSAFDSIYIGYGVKATQPAFYPMGPENLLVEGQDIDQVSEPNPSSPPDEIQPDSDDQNKKPEE